MSRESDDGKMGLFATWSMAAGGMVGGGIFAALGVVISVAGKWSWVSFTLAGIIALITAYSYVDLARTFGEKGGAFTFLREIDLEGFAGSLSWVLIIGYILTMAVYAFTFGHYLSFALGWGGVLTRVAAVAIVAGLVTVNLIGVGETTGVEIVIVWSYFIVLVAFALTGIGGWEPEQLSRGISSHGLFGTLMGSATIFMAYEGFQLLTYDYDQIDNPEQTLPRGVLSAVVVVVLIYVGVLVGATMILGAETMIQRKEVALSLAAQQLWGMPGLIVMTLAATFATGAAINSTLFSTARLSERVADDGEFPAFMDHRNKQNIPVIAVMILGGLSTVLAVIGSLSNLVEAASLAFLFTFATVNYLAYRIPEEGHWISLGGALLAGGSVILLTGRLVLKHPLALSCFLAVVLTAIFGRPYILRHTRTED